MEPIFTCGDRAQDLNDWASKLDTLGSVIETIGYDGDNSWLCKNLGLIICDYAQALEATLSAFYPEISKAVDDFDYPALVGIERDYKKIKNHHECPYKTDLIKENLEKIQEFKEKTSFVFDLEEKFKKSLNGQACKEAK